jgi:hypothetical protein
LLEFGLPIERLIGQDPAIPTSRASRHEAFSHCFRNLIRICAGDFITSFY